MDGGHTKSTLVFNLPSKHVMGPALVQQGSLIAWKVGGKGGAGAVGVPFNRTRTHTTSRELPSCAETRMACAGEKIWSTTGSKV